jgi:hypothetical protein
MQIAFSFDKQTLGKIVRGAVIAAGGAGIVYALQMFMTLDFGQATPVVVAVASILLNAVKEYINGVPKELAE